MKNILTLSAFACMLVALSAFGPCCKRQVCAEKREQHSTCCHTNGGGVAMLPSHCYDADEAAGYNGDKEIAAIVQREAAAAQTVS